MDLKAKPARGYPMFKLVGHPHMSQTPNLLPGLNVGMHAGVHNWRVAGRDAADAPPEEVNTDQPGLLGLVGLQGPQRLHNGRGRRPVTGPKTEG